MAAPYRGLRGLRPPSAPSSLRLRANALALRGIFLMSRPPLLSRRGLRNLSRFLFVALAFTVIPRALAQQPPLPELTVPPPLADHHQDLFSPAIAELISPRAPAPPVSPIT